MEAGRWASEAGGKWQSCTKLREGWKCFIYLKKGLSECSNQWQTSGRAVCTRSRLACLWFGLPSDTTHIPQERETLLFDLYQYKIVRLTGEITNRGNGKEKVKNRESTAKIRSVSRYGYACIRRGGLNNTAAALTHRSNEEQRPMWYLKYSMFLPDLGLRDKMITISIAIDTWSISIENTFDRTFDNFTELCQKQLICEWQNTVWDPVAGQEVYARNSVYFRSKRNLISDTDTDCRTSVSGGSTVEKM